MKWRGGNGKGELAAGGGLTSDIAEISLEHAVEALKSI